MIQTTTETKPRPHTILSLGSINADFQVRVGRRPEISETVIAHDYIRVGGGKAANVAYLARLLNIPVRLFGHVGDDDLAEQALAPLRQLDVDLADVDRVAGQQTGFAMVTVPPDGKKGIVLAPNANEVWSHEESLDLADKIAHAPARAVLVLDCEIPADVALRAAQTARGAGHIVVLDPSPADRINAQLLEQVHFITPNAAEAQQLTGIACEDVESAIQAGNALRDKGVGAACIKLPDGGCILVESHQVTHVSAVPVEVEDTTGAGDAYAGALAAALVLGRPAPDAACFAVAASHLAVTRYGSQAAYADMDHITEMERQLEMRTHDIQSSGSPTHAHF